MAARTSIVEQRAPLVSAGAYRRVVAASIERVWENVLDWEHLPHLHHDSFAALELLSAWSEGWRAVVTMVPELGGTTSEIELVVDKPHLAYTTRTLEGVGAGMEIITSLEAFDAHTTRIDVDFLIPGLAERFVEAVGVYYRRLYARIWDQDEAMMTERQRQLDRAAVTPVRFRETGRAPVPLGDEASLRRRLPLLIEIAGRLYRIAEAGGEIVVHSAVCPHMGGPLGAARIDDDGCVTCPWHGYRFDVRTCRNTDGRRLKLARSPRVEVDATGEAYLRWAA